MARDYSWARQTIPRDCLTVGEIALLLGVGRHAARRRLLKAGLPARLVVRHWRHGGQLYTRRCWAIPEVAAMILLTESQRTLCRRAGKVGRPFLRRIDHQLVQLRSRLTQHTDNPR